MAPTHENEVADVIVLRNPMFTGGASTNAEEKGEKKGTHVHEQCAGKSSSLRGGVSYPDAGVVPAETTFKGSTFIHPIPGT